MGVTAIVVVLLGKYAALARRECSYQRHWCPPLAVAAPGLCDGDAAYARPEGDWGPFYLEHPDGGGAPPLR
jgi:hypothetical protein